MIDHLIGRPSTSLKRLQVLAVLAFWGSVLKKGSLKDVGANKQTRALRLLHWANRRAARFSPWKIVLATLMLLYSLRHIDSIFGFGAPEPLALMYSRSFYRVTWIVTALDAGFATAMNVKPKWLRDILSVVFSFYYIVYANEADEKLRKYRALCTVEMLRCTWEKTTNPYLRMATWFHRPSLPIARPILLPRPIVGPHAKRPIQAWLFYANGKEADLAKEEELYLDFPGGGFICMNPLHHEERLRQLAKEVQRPILAIDYCKAPEYPYPYALEECFDVYRTLIETRGKAIGMSGSSRMRIILSGDSAGGNLATAVMLKILEYPQPHIKSAYATLAAGGRGSVPPPLPKPISMILAYPSLNFSFTAWMKPEHLRVLKAQSEVNLQTLQREATQSSRDGQEGRKGSPLRPRSRSRSRSRQASLLSLTSSTPSSSLDPSASNKAKSSKQSRRPVAPKDYQSLASQAALHLADRARLADAEPASEEAVSPNGSESPFMEQRQFPQTTADSAVSASPTLAEADEIQRELALSQQQADKDMSSRRKKAPVGTRLTMSSMSGYFQDRILTQSMMRAMAILYIGPRRQPDFDHDYLLSPVVAPARLLAEFPPVLFLCGEKDPICDDTVIMAGRIREAKLAKQADIKRRRAGASSRFGEGLRMSVGTSQDDEPDPIEDESVEDWVQMRIIASVSHGLLQMGALWPEAKHIISFIAAWTVEAFEDETDRLSELREQQLQQQGSRNGVSHNRAQTLPAPATQIPELQVDSANASIASARGDLDSPSKRTSDAKDGSVIKDDEDDDDDDDDDEAPLSFTPRRMRSPSTRHISLGSGINTPTNASPQLNSVTLPGSPSKVSLSSHQIATHGQQRLQSPAVLALRPDGSDGTRLSRPGAASGSRSRPSSFSDVYQSRTSVAAESGLLSPSEAPTAIEARLQSPTRRRNNGLRRSSFAGRDGSSVAGGSDVEDLLSSSQTGVRRSSRGPGGTQAGGAAAALDERTKALLVNEGHLLQRRRQEAVSGLGSSAIHSDSDEPKSEEEEGDSFEQTNDRQTQRGRSTGSASLRRETDDQAEASKEASAA